MNSPPEPASPESSSQSSATPPPDEILLDQFPTAPTHNFGAELQALAQSPSQTKRRLPTSGSHAHIRDTKSRKREDGSSRRHTAAWVDREGGSKQRDELVDMDLVERLRKDFGDPFDESSLKNVS